MQKLLVTPQQLNRFSKYLSGVEDFDDFYGMIEYLNNGPGEHETNSDLKTFEFKESVFSESFTSISAKDVKALIPSVGIRNVKFSYDLVDMTISGNMDFLGFGKAVIIQEVDNYKMPGYLRNHFNWILKAWEGQMLKRLDYIVSTRDGVCMETYTPGSYNFKKITEEAEELRYFIKENSELITNPILVTQLIK